MVRLNTPAPPPWPSERHQPAQVGDIISARDLPMVVGQVLAVGSVACGKTDIPGYLIRVAPGRTDFIPASDAEWLARGSGEGR